MHIGIRVLREQFPMADQRVFYLHVQRFASLPRSIVAVRIYERNVKVIEQR